MTTPCMIAIERYLDELDLRRLESDHALTLEGWRDPSNDAWRIPRDDDEES